MYKASGTVRYSDNNTGWVVALINEDLISYYRSMIPKYYYVQAPMYQAHITIVRIRPKEYVNSSAMWGQYEGHRINFDYDGIIHIEEPYFYLKAWSRPIELIRQRLGLPNFRAGFDCYHITIGNIKGQALPKFPSLIKASDK